MRTVYESTFIAVGLYAQESLDDNFIITFGEGASSEVAEYCFIHRIDVNHAGDFGAGSVMTIGQHNYPVTAAGSVAYQNLRELGHITVRFDGADRAEFPGTVHVAGRAPVSIEPGQTFRLVSK